MLENWIFDHVPCAALPLPAHEHTFGVKGAEFRPVTAERPEGR